MLTHQAFRYELAPTAEQRVTLANHAGAARWAWNWGLAVRRKAWHRRRQTMSAVELHRLLNRIKHTPRFAWLSEVSKCAPQEALRDLDRACANYWRGQKNGRRVGFPRFKKQGRCPERFRLTGAIRVEHGGVVLPRIGRAATKEETGKFKGRILSATCRREADRWYVAVNVEVERRDPVPGWAGSGSRPRHRRSTGGNQVGDRGGGPVCSRHGPQPPPGSRHQRPRRSEFHRQLAYKCQWHGSRLLVAPRFYPSSEACSGCGLAKAELPLNVRTFQCEACGLVIDRDQNAARNLAALAASDSNTAMVAGSSLETENACGGESAGPAVLGWVQLASAKQERAHQRLANA